MPDLIYISRARFGILLGPFLDPYILLSAYAKPIWEFSFRYLFDLGNPFTAPYRHNLQLKLYSDYARSA
jgi:hypothetical protein